MPKTFHPACRADSHNYFGFPNWLLLIAEQLGFITCYSLRLASDFMFAYILNTGRRPVPGRRPGRLRP